MADGQQRTTEPQALPPQADQPYRLVLERIHDGVAFVAPSGDISYCNRRFADILGVPVETIIGSRLGGFLRESDRAPVDEMLQQGSGQREAALERADGTRISVYLSVSTLMIGDERAAVVVLTDGDPPSAREHASLEIARFDREAFEREHQMRRALLAEMGDRYFAMDQGWRYTEFNAQAEAQLQALGKDPATLIGKVMWDEFSAPPPVEAVLRRVMQDRKPVVHEHYYAPLGEWVENRIYPSADGGIRIFQRYVTERKRLEEQHRRTAAYLADAQALSHTGSWVWNPGTRELSWSAEHFRIFGLDPQQPTPTYDVAVAMIHPDDRQRVEETFAAAVADSTAYTLDMRIVRPGGEIRHVRSIGHPMFDQSGRRLEYVGTLIDMTERVEADDALHRSQHELAHVARVVSLGVLTASIGHDLNQFIVAILTNGSACLHWLSREPADLDEGAAAVRRIMRDAALAGDFIGSIRAFLQKTAGRKTSLNIADVVQQVRLLVDAEAEKNHVAFEQSVARGLPPVLAVRVELQQVLLNLIMNALEAMAEVSDRPRILGIRCTADDADHPPVVLVTIADSGSGFAADPERLFDAFYTTKPQGLGMGLAIARTIVEAHGGRLWATANPLHGATFHFTIPAAPQP